MPAVERVPLADIERLAMHALTRAGARPAAAASLARAIGAAEAEGQSSQGLAYLGIYCEHLHCGKVIADAVPRIERPRPGQIVVDAGAGFAHPAIDAGFAELVPAARSQGIAALAVRNSYNCGVLGYHTERLAAEGLVGLGFTNAPASIAPSGGRKPLFGTNPWALAVPDGKGGAAIAIDQSASTISKSLVIQKARRGESVPLGWVLGPDGAPTTDPNIGLKGSMAPSGGYKGVGIAILVEVMSACLAGAMLGMHASTFGTNVGGPPRTGQYFIAIEPATPSGGLFHERIEAILAAYAAEPGTHLPGSGRKAARERAGREGVEVDGELLAKVRALAA